MRVDPINSAGLGLACKTALLVSNKIFAENRRKENSEREHKKQKHDEKLTERRVVYTKNSSRERKRNKERGRQTEKKAGRRGGETTINREYE
jgi:hypothetical protein